jgi:hypothetical protein
LGARLFTGDLLLAWQDRALFHVPLDGSRPQKILEVPGELGPMSVDSGGKSALVRRTQNDQQTWFLVPLDGSPAREIMALEDLHPLALEKQADWVLFAESQAPMQGASGSPYVSLDMRTASTTVLLTQDSSAIYTVADRPAAHGRYHFVHAVEPGLGRLWLLDGASGGGRLVAETAGNVSGQLSPDGCYLAVSIFDALGEGRQGLVEVHNLQSGNISAILADSVLLGWVAY